MSDGWVRVWRDGEWEWMPPSMTISKYGRSYAITKMHVVPWRKHLWRLAVWLWLRSVPWGGRVGRPVRVFSWSPSPFSPPLGADRLFGLAPSRVDVVSWAQAREHELREQAMRRAGMPERIAEGLL